VLRKALDLFDVIVRHADENRGGDDDDDQSVVSSEHVLILAWALDAGQSAALRPWNYLLKVNTASPQDYVRLLLDVHHRRSAASASDTKLWPLNTSAPWLSVVSRW